MENLTPIGNIRLKHFGADNEPDFLNLIKDDSIKEYFHELDDEEEIIISKLRGINGEIPLVQYWGIFTENDLLLGFVTMRKNFNVYKTLQEISKESEVDFNFDIIDETPDEGRKRKWLEKLKAPYVIEIAVHKEFRKRNIGKIALTLVINYACSVAIGEVFMEVRDDNEQSIALIKNFNPKLVADSTVHYGYRIYSVTTNLDLSTEKELANERLALIDVREIEMLNFFRHTIKHFPELMPLRELIYELYNSILATGAKLELNEQIATCHHSNDFLGKHVTVGLAKRNDPMTLIWSIAHEFGHIQQDEPTKEELLPLSKEQYLREVDAWEKAEDWLSEKPFYLFNWSSFVRFRNRRLESYLPDNLSNE